MELVGSVVGMDRERARGAPALLRRFPRRIKIERAHAFHSQQRPIPAINRIADIEAIQRVARLVFAAAVKMQAAARILNHARHQLHGTSQAVRRRIRNIVDFGSTETLFALGLLRIHRRRQFANRDALKHVLLLIDYQRDFGTGRRYFHRAILEREVSAAIHVDEERARLRQRQTKCARWSGIGFYRSLRAPMRGDTSVSDGRIILVDHAAGQDDLCVSAKSRREAGKREAHDLRSWHIQPVGYYSRYPNAS